MKPKYIGQKILIATLLSLVFTQCVKKSLEFSDGTDEGGLQEPNVTVDTSRNTIDKSKLSQARVFPGLVTCSGAANRLENYKLEMDLNYSFVAENLRIATAPEPLFSTGLYAAPGELAIIDVPPGEYAISAQIGAWTDNLSNVLNAPRDPVIYSRIQLAPGRNYIRNLYGGHIYIRAARPLEQKLTLTFSNVLKSPDFVLGKTTNAEWKAAVQNSCVPWLEFRTEYIIFTVPRSLCLERPVDDPEELMKLWDKAIQTNYYDWEGLSDEPVDPVDQSPKLPWRVVMDIKPSAGYGHSGYPVVTYNDYGWFAEMTDISRIRKGACWGIFHEIGHNNQQPNYWSWSTLIETSNNLFAPRAANTASLTDASAWPPNDQPGLVTAIPDALSFAAKGGSKDFDGSDALINGPFHRMTPFLQMMMKYPGGDGIITELYKQARRAQYRSNNDQDKRDFVYEKVSEYTQKDWRFFFKAWGITVSNTSLNKIDQKGYPAMSQEIWKYNPMTRQGGDSQYDPYNRAGWTLSATSVNNEGGGIPALVDGDVGTYWHTAYNPADASMPQRITIDIGNSIPIKGFKFVQRQSLSRNIKNLTVEISSNGSTWTAVTGSPFLLQKITAEQVYPLANTVNARFIRLSILSKTDTYNGGTTTDANNICLAEVNVIKP